TLEMNPMSGWRASTSWTRLEPHRPVPKTKAYSGSASDPIAVPLQIRALDRRDQVDRVRSDPVPPGRVPVREREVIERQPPLRVIGEPDEARGPLQRRDRVVDQVLVPEPEHRRVRHRAQAR